MYKDIRHMKISIFIAVRRTIIFSQQGKINLNCELSFVNCELCKEELKHKANKFIMQQFC